MRKTFYDALRAVPLYPRRAAALPLLLAFVAVVHARWGWLALAATFLVVGMLSLFTVDGVRDLLARVAVAVAAVAGSCT
jgi:hypothetical protein